MDTSYMGGSPTGGASTAYNNTNPIANSKYMGTGAIVGGSLGGGGGTGVKGATMFDAASLAAGYDAQNRQRYIDQATTNAKIQQQNQTGEAQRTAAMQGRRYLSSPAQMIGQAANLAAAGTQGGWQADSDSFNKRMQVANLAQQGNMFNLQSANAWNQANYQQGMLGVAQQGVQNQTNAMNRAANTQDQMVQGYNIQNQNNPYGFTNYTPGQSAGMNLSGSGSSLNMGSTYGGGISQSQSANDLGSAFGSVMSGRTNQ